MRRKERESKVSMAKEKEARNLKSENETSE